MQKEKHTSRYFLVLFIITLLILFFDRMGFLVSIKGRTGDFFSLPQENIYSLWQKFFKEIRHFSYWKTGDLKIRNLEQRNRELLVEASQADTLRIENKTLREQLGILPDIKKKYLTARVIGLKDGLLINKGTRDNIKVGWPVLYKDFLIGVIESVSPYNAKVKILLDSDFKIEAYDQETLAKGVVKGQFDNSFLFDNVLQTDNLNLGDIIVTSGENLKVPENLLIGKVVEIKKKEADVFQKAILESFINYKELEYVFLLEY